MDFENKVVGINGMYLSRYIASFIVGSHLTEEFIAYLKRLQKDERTKLTDEDVKEIYKFGTNGKLEYQNSKYFEKV